MKIFEVVKITGKGITRDRWRDLVWKTLIQMLKTEKLYAVKKEFHYSHHIFN